MTSERITENKFHQECETLAREIFDEVMSEAAADEDAEHHRDTMQDRAHEVADGHQWVIYHHYAHQICAECDTQNGEQFLEDVGMPESPTYDSIGSMIAYGEMRCRIEAAIEDLIAEWEPVTA